MSKRTLFLIFALFVITFVLFVIAVYNPYSTKPLTPIPTAIPTAAPAAQSTLLFGSLSDSISSASSKTTYSLPINIATGNNKVTAVQLELQYDPKVLTNVAVTPGSFFKNPQVLLNQIDAKTGRISYAFGIGFTDQGVMGQGIAATINFEAKTTAAQETAILFLPKTLVTAEGITESVLKETNAAQFSVGK